MGRRLARHPRRQRHLAGQRDCQRDHHRRARQRGVHPPRHRRLRGLQGVRRPVPPRAGRARLRRAEGADQAARPRLRPGRPRPDLLDPGNHRAPQCRRQRPRADQPVPAHRPCGPLRLRAGAAARAEQRPGRRRHGRYPEQADRLPGHRARPRRAPPVRREVRRHHCAQEGHAPVADVRRDGPRRANLRLHHRREPDELRGGHAPHPQDARGPRVPGGSGHRPDADRQGGRRRAARHRVLVRVRGHGHQQRAPRAAGPQGDRAAGRRPRRHRDHRRAGPAARLRLGPSDAAGAVGRAAHAFPDARGHELREDRAARRRPVALPRRGVGRHDVPARPPLGGGPGQARRPRPVPPNGAGRPARHAHRRVPDQAHYRSPPRLLQHGCRDQRVLHSAAAQGDAQPLARGLRPAGFRRRRVRAGHVAARHHHRPRDLRTRRCGRGWRS